MLIEETAVPSAALPLTEFKAHLRLGTGFSDSDIQDPVLENFLRAAIASVEGRTGKVLIARDFAWSLSEWRDTGAQTLPVAPVNSIISLTLQDPQGDDELISPAFYRLERDTQCPVMHAVGPGLPAIPVGGRAEIVFTAGYSQDWGGLPGDLAQAVMLLAAHYHAYRDETKLGDGCMPFGVSSLIERYRKVRLLGGGCA